jgi:hypothetical protein
MSDSVQELAVKKSGQSLPRVAKDQAVSFTMPFDAIKHLLQGYPAPKRPNRTGPVQPDDPELREELEAWEAASDEAFEAAESDSPE